MIAAFGVAIPIGLLGGLSVSLGYLVRYADSMPAEAKAFSPFGFAFASLAAFFVLTVAMFFGSAIPTMLYSMGLIAYMLRRLRSPSRRRNISQATKVAGKRCDREKLVSTILGGVLGLLSGIPCTTLGMIIAETAPRFSLYTTLWRWPALLSVDGLFLLWMTLIPLVNIVAGIRTGWKIGERLEEAKLYWFWS